MNTDMNEKVIETPHGITVKGVDNSKRDNTYRKGQKSRGEIVNGFMDSFEIDDCMRLGFNDCDDSWCGGIDGAMEDFVENGYREFGFNNVDEGVEEFVEKWVGRR